MTLYEFIDIQKATYHIKDLCRVLGVPPSSYFDWNAGGRDRHQARADAEAELIDAIGVVHDESAGSYGSPRVHEQLRRDGRRVTRRRVAETMARAGIVGLTGRERSTTTTRRDRLAAPFPDLVGGNFTAEAPDTLWYGDVTYIWVGTRFWYLATVIDAATKELVGWCFDDHMRTELVATALERAVARRGGVAAGLIFHSDRGSQYTSGEYAKVCASYGIRQSMGRRGVCFDNAAAESFFASLKRELVNRFRWDDAKILGLSLFNWIETWYNRRRLHSSIGYRPPVEAYEEYLASQRAA